MKNMNYFEIDGNGGFSNDGNEKNYLDFLQDPFTENSSNSTGNGLDLDSYQPAIQEIPCQCCYKLHLL